MPAVLAPLSSLLINGVHRFVRCWQLTRTDGVILRFTEHSSSLVVDNNTYSPIGTPSASAKEHKDGTAPSNFSVSSYISSTAITYEDLLAGRFRDAIVIEFIVDWQYPWLGKLSESTYKIVETTFNKEVWEAQIENNKTKLRQKIGRVYNRNCDKVFGSADCGKDLAPLTQSGTVAVITSSKLAFDATTTPQADEYFNDGTIIWTSGLNNGLKSEVKLYMATGDIELHVETPFDIVVGDTFSISPGCARTSVACKSFSNFPNFGGYPYIPGNDKLYSTPNAH